MFYALNHALEFFVKDGGTYFTLQEGVESAHKLVKSDMESTLGPDVVSATTGENCYTEILRLGHLRRMIASKGAGSPALLPKPYEPLQHSGRPPLSCPTAIVDPAPLLSTLGDVNYWHPIVI